MYLFEQAGDLVRRQRDYELLMSHKLKPPGDFRK